MNTKKENDCEKYELDLTRYVSGDFDRIKNMDNFTSHLKDCSECKNNLNELQKIVGILRGGKELSSKSQKSIEKIVQESKKWSIPKKSEYPDVSPLIETGKDFLKDGKYESAIKYFDDALFLNPKDGVAWYFKGRAHYAIGEYSIALKSFNKSIDYDVLNLSGIYYKGRIEQKLGIKEDLSGVYKSIENKIALLEKEIKQMKRAERLLEK